MDGGTNRGARHGMPEGLLALILGFVALLLAMALPERRRQQTQPAGSGSKTNRSAARETAEAPGDHADQRFLPQSWTFSAALLPRRLAAFWPAALALIALTVFLALAVVLPANVSNVFNSPDETSNYTFTRTLAEHGRLWYTEDYLPLDQENLLHPRGSLTYRDRIVPFNYLGLPVLYAAVFRVMGDKLIYISLVFALVSAWALYRASNLLFGARAWEGLGGTPVIHAPHLLPEPALHERDPRDGVFLHRDMAVCALLPRKARARPNTCVYWLRARDVHALRVRAVSIPTGHLGARHDSEPAVRPRLLSGFGRLLLCRSNLLPCTGCNSEPERLWQLAHLRLLALQSDLLPRSYVGKPHGWSPDKDNSGVVSALVPIRLQASVDQRSPPHVTARARVHGGRRNGVGAGLRASRSGLCMHYQSFCWASICSSTGLRKHMERQEYIPPFSVAVVRYWLPFYALMFLVAVYGLSAIRDNALKLALVGALALIGTISVYYQNPDSLTTEASAACDLQGWGQNVLAPSTEPDALIYASRSDKRIVPYRSAATWWNGSEFYDAGKSRPRSAGSRLPPPDLRIPRA